MLLTGEFMKNLKQANVSKDTEKTKERIRADFSAASASQKRTIVETSGQAQNSFYRVYKTGTTNARLVIALANELNVSPFFYTGETDEKEACSDELLRQFLEEHGYSELIAEFDTKPMEKAKRPYKKREKQDVKTEPHEIAAVDNLSSVDDSIKHDIQVLKEASMGKHEIDTFNNMLSEDEAATLLKALYIRAKSNDNAAGNLKAVIERLLS